MEGIVYERVSSLDKSRSDWKIKARVTRMWATVSPDTGITKGFNLILLDNDNSHFHAFSFADTWKVIGKNVVEGGVYIIETFSVRDAAGNLKLVSTDICIRFTNATTFQQCPNDVMIPNHKFEFFDLDDLYSEASSQVPGGNPEFAIDIIGVVENFVKVSKIKTRYGERDIVRFKICDASNRHRVGVWGELAKVVSEEYEKFEGEKDIIVILTSIKMSTYNNSVQISTLPSSKVYFNLADDTVSEMRQRLEDEGYKPHDDVVDSTYPEPIVSPYESISLKELTENTSENAQKKLRNIFTIEKLEEGTAWFVYSCSKCHYEVLPFGKRFKCEKCTRILPVADKRFCVKAIVFDATFSTSVFLMDRVVKRLTGQTATQLYLNQTKEEQLAKVIPAVLYSMAGKEVSSVIQINQSIQQPIVFLIHAYDIYEAGILSDSNTESSSHMGIPSIDLSESFDQAETSKTPGSAKSVTKKIKMEK